MSHCHDVTRPSAMPREGARCGKETSVYRYLNTRSRGKKCCGALCSGAREVSGGGSSLCTLWGRRGKRGVGCHTQSGMRHEQQIGLLSHSLGFAIRLVHKFMAF